MNYLEKIYNILMEQGDISKAKKPTGFSGPQLGGQRVHPGTMSPVRQRINPTTGKREIVPLVRRKTPPSTEPINPKRLRKD
tara:strand:+ start:6619 stop:6861 length:243 start_codon:yes stop_codon:yes gene_type:complete